MQTRGEFTPAAAEEGHKRCSQRLLILGALVTAGAFGVRRRELKSLGGDRFSARINELRADGHRILGPAKAPRWGIQDRAVPFEDGEDRYLLTAQPRCSDCGVVNETSGHMTCAFPEDRP